VSIDPVVSAAWVAEHAAGIVLADVRWYLDGRSGREAYDTGHIPGAVFVDLDRWLASHGRPADQGRHPLPDPDTFAEGMGLLGISDDSTVVAYDDAGGVIASRLVWMLRATGHDAAVLDGGIAAWPGDLTTVEPVPGAAVFTATAWPADRLATIDEAAAGDAIVLDARDGNRYRGETEPVDPQAGHIPGAQNLVCREHLAADGTFLPVDELRERFAAVGVTGEQDVISYCGSGVTACHNLIAQEHAGLGVGRLYPGSWSAWSNTLGRAVATGAEPGKPA
jgi:thiosulfate/3-mercaptopyruvate sulfurtransferase